MGLVVTISLVSSAVVGDVIFEGGDADELPGVRIVVLLGAPETGIAIVVSLTVTEGVDFKLVFVALLAWEGSVALVLSGCLVKLGDVITELPAVLALY